MDFVHAHPITPRLREPLRAALRGENAEWPELTRKELDALVEHGVVPLIYRVTGLPVLRDEAIRAAAREPILAAGVVEVLAALHAHGVAPLLMKGTALAYDVYPAPELRPRGDSDLLIDASSAAATREAMLALGFTERIGSGDEHGVRQMSFRSAGGITYDIHWSALNTPLFDSLFRYDELVPRSIPLPRLGPHARGFGRVDALLLAAVHRVAHHHDSDRVIWLEDITLLREDMTAAQHEEFWRRAAEHRVVSVCRRSLELADEWTSKPPRNPAEEWLSAEELGRREASAIFLERDITRGGVLVANLRALPWRARFRRAWQLSFPPPAFMREAFRVKHGWMLPWMYVYRGARGVARLFRRAAGSSSR